MGTPESDHGAAAPRVLTYHKIGSQLELGISSVARDRLITHLDALVGLGMEFTTATGSPGGPAGRRPVAITFDDGYESVYTDAFPEVCGRGLTATVFPVVGAIGKADSWAWDVRLSVRPFKHLSWSEIDELARHGFEIGSHTVSHRDLTRLDADDLKAELAVSRKRLEDRTGRPVTALAYPFGRTNQRVVEAAVDAGYRRGFLSSPVALGLGRSRCAGPNPAAMPKGWPMVLGRMSVYRFDGPASLMRKLGVRRGYRFEVLKNALITGLSRGTTLVTRSRRPAGDE